MSVRLTKLDSGIIVVTDPMPHLKTAAVGIWVGAGSRHENPAEHGISHLLEHMAFKGTKRRNARQIAEEIEGRRRPQCGDQPRDDWLLRTRARRKRRACARYPQRHSH
jgi:predicted Zn-dependent peptidase